MGALGDGGAGHGVEVEGHGQHPLERAAIQAPLVAALGGGQAARVALHRAAHARVGEKVVVVGAVAAVERPAQAEHHILRVKAVLEAVEHGQRLGGILGPRARHLAVRAAAPHGLDGTQVQLAALHPLHRQAQRVAHREAEHAALHTIQQHGASPFPKGRKVIG
jgi:hypothetical protein